MLSYGVYKLFHLLGIFLVFVAVGGVTVHAAGGGDKESNPARRALTISHGIGLLLMLAYLRLGEQQNCLVNHTSDSCLFPIDEAGVHRIEGGSRLAIEEMLS